MACEGFYCLILVLPCLFSLVRRALAGVAQLVERMFYVRLMVRICFPAQLF